ncbi:MAG: hypothetical protein ACLPVY_05340 [Acidimicrobiia bacterium]
MGIAYRCHANLGCTFVVWDGDVTPDQWSDELDRIIADLAFPPGPLVLADLSTAGGAPSITTGIVDEMARRWVTYAAELAPMQWAIIPDGAWDKARRFECEVKGSNIRPMVFNEPWSACTWLGLDAAVARTILGDLREELRS